MATKTLTPTHKIVLHDTTLPPQAQAAHIALLTLKTTRCTTWEQLVNSPEAQQLVRLNQQQQNLIDTYSHILPLLRAKPVRTIAVCTHCDRFLFTANTGTAKSRCTLSPACVGQLVKVPSTVVKVLAAA